jgi:hypothetical protein
MYIRHIKVKSPHGGYIHALILADVIVWGEVEKEEKNEPKRR